MKNNGGSTSSLLKHLQGKHPQVYLSATGATADGILDSSETIDVKPRIVEIDEGENKDEEDEDELSDHQEAGYGTDDETWVYIFIYFVLTLQHSRWVCETQSTLFFEYLIDR